MTFREIVVVGRLRPRYIPTAAVVDKIRVPGK